MVKRYAFTMIELIFAIVVIAVAVVSLPVMTQTTDKNIEGNIVQEAVFASEAVINEAIGYYWDFSSISVSTPSRVVNTGDCVAGVPNRRVGHIDRTCIDDLALGVQNDNAQSRTVDSIANVYNGSSIILNNDATTAYATYKNNYTATATVIQCTNGAGCIQFGQNPFDADLKEIDIAVSDSNGIIVRMRAYMANIGEITQIHRDSL